MAGWINQIVTYLKSLYAYWRDVIIIFLGGGFFLLGIFIYYPIQWFVPSALRLLFAIILTLFFMLLGAVILSFLPYAGTRGIEYPVEPTKLVDFRIFFEKYGRFIEFGAMANLLYFIALTMYFFKMGDKMTQALSSESLGIPVFLSWIILNCALVIASCGIIYLSEPSPNLLRTLAPLIPGLGQVMNGEDRKGEVFLLGIFLGFFFHHPLSIMMALVIWLYSFYDAYEVSRESRDGSQSPVEASGSDVFVHIILVWILGAVVVAVY
jgi:hypothetical protein